MVKKYLFLSLFATIFVLSLIYIIFQNSINKISPVIIPPTTSKFACPTTEWVDCMPGLGVQKPHCQPEYLKWAQENCPNFKGAAL